MEKGAELGGAGGRRQSEQRCRLHGETQVIRCVIKVRMTNNCVRNSKRVDGCSSIAGLEYSSWSVQTLPQHHQHPHHHHHQRLNYHQQHLLSAHCSLAIYVKLAFNVLDSPTAIDELPFLLLLLLLLSSFICMACI